MKNGRLNIRGFWMLRLDNENLQLGAQPHKDVDYDFKNLRIMPVSKIKKKRLSQK